MTTYTTQQITSGDYDVTAFFGHTFPNCLPFRAVGFDETDVDGVFEGSAICQETLAEAIESRNLWFAPAFTMGIYQLAPDGRAWHLIPESWKH